MGFEIAVLIPPLVTALESLRLGGVQAERIAFLKEKLEMIRERVVALEKENAKPETENRKLFDELATYRVSEDYVERGGALFRREGPNRYSEVPRCPGCRGPMVSQARTNAFNYRCGDPKCGRIADFTRPGLRRILAKLNRGATATDEPEEAGGQSG